MANRASSLQPSSYWKTFLQKQLQPRRRLTTTSPTPRVPQPPPRPPYRYPHSKESKPRLKTYPPPPSAQRRFPSALQEAVESHLATLDPTGARRRLFSRANLDGPRPGDILLASFKSDKPFAGVCLNIRHRGVDTSVLLRNKVMGTGVEMWVKIFSPNVTGIELVKRAQKRPRRARLYYMRKPEHDPGNVETAVEQYLHRKRLFTIGSKENFTALYAGSKSKKGKTERRGGKVKREGQDSSVSTTIKT